LKLELMPIQSIERRFTTCPQKLAATAMRATGAAVSMAQKCWKTRSRGQPRLRMTANQLLQLRRLKPVLPVCNVEESTSAANGNFIGAGAQMATARCRW
jgi:hypothetical protein